MTKPIPTKQEILKYLRYDGVSGKLFWKLRTDNSDGTRMFNAKCAGKEAGTVKDGYCVVKLNKVPYYAHRLVWKIITGRDIVGCLDHIDANTFNNRFENLRDVSHAQNLWNTKIKRGNTTGYKGVGFNKRLGKWTARIRADGNQKHLGVFDNPKLAHAAFVNATRKYRDKFARVA